MSSIDQLSDRFQQSPLIRSAAYGLGLYCLVSPVIAANQLSTLTVSHWTWRRIALGGGILAAAGYLHGRTPSGAPRPAPPPEQPPSVTPPAPLPSSELLAPLPPLKLMDYDPSRVEAYLQGSEYYATQSTFRITVPQGEIEEGKKSHIHLRQLIALFSAEANQGFNDLLVTLLDEGGERAKGVDLGGVQRQYLDSLCSGLVRGLQLTQFQNTALYVPARAIQNEGELQAYRDWGSLLVFCYQTKSHRGACTGAYLDPSVIGAALSLSADELDRECDQLSRASRCQFYRKLIDLQSPDLGRLSDPLKVIEAQDETEANRWREILGEDPAPEKSAVDQLEEIVMGHLQGAGLACQLGPIYAFAQGMSLLCNGSWDTFRSSVNRYTLSDKAQGLVDRRDVANCFQAWSWDKSSKRLQKVVAEWIVNQATGEEIRIMMRTLTGCAGLGRRQTIRIDDKNFCDYPTINSSDSDRTREEKMLQQLRAREPMISTCILHIKFCGAYIKTLSDTELLEYFKGAVLVSGAFTER